MAVIALLLVSPLMIHVFGAEYCPSKKLFDLAWPRIPVHKNVSMDCSTIDPSWAGTFTANCIVDPDRKVTWSFKGGCECEKKTVLEYFKNKVSLVDHDSFLDTASELVNSEKNFTNREVFKGFINVLIQNVCNNPPLLKTEQWDRIHLYCKRGLTAVMNRDRSSHFDQYLCQEVENTSSGDETSIVVDSLSGGKRDRGFGEKSISLNDSSSHDQHNISSLIIDTLKNVSSSDCEVLEYTVTDNQLTIKVTKSTTNSRMPQKIREKLELTFITVSLVAILCSLVILSFVRVQSSEKIFVHKNFLLAWALGYLVYILDVITFTDRHDYPGVCTFIVVTRHFFHTAVFTWMLVEAINLYIKLVKVISIKTHYMMYLAVGWGVPSLIVGITAAATKARAYDMSKMHYEEIICGSLKFTVPLLRSSCWLVGSAWLYSGPVLAILLVNLAFFAILLNVVLGKIANRYDGEKIMKTRKGMKSVATLLPLLGVTWLLGFFVEYHEALAFAFVLLTSTQGIVFFIFHCILDEQVRTCLTQRFRKGPVDSGSLPTRS